MARQQPKAFGLRTSTANERGEIEEYDTLGDAVHALQLDAEASVEGGDEEDLVITLLLWTLYMSAQDRDCYWHWIPIASFDDKKKVFPIRLAEEVRYGYNDEKEE